MTLAPFDAAAARYDDDFTSTALGHSLRSIVWRHADRSFAAGDDVLDLGCGTGEDALHLARNGIGVLGIDASEAMLAVARAKCASLGPRFVRADLDDAVALDAALGSRRFRGVLSNFGALNCVGDRARVFRRLGDAIDPGGRLVLVVMGPLAAWEIAWHLFRCDPRRAFRRFGGPRPARVGAGRDASLPIEYPSSRRLARELAPAFRVTRVDGLGVALPPSHLRSLVEGHAGRLARLERLERRLASRRVFRSLGDHLVVQAVRT